MCTVGLGAHIFYFELADPCITALSREPIALEDNSQLSSLGCSMIKWQTIPLPSR